MERVAELADRRANPLRVVADINARLGHTACIYATKPEVRARTVRFEKNIAANHSDYAIYQVQVTAHGVEKTEIGDIVWTFCAAADDVYAARRGAGADRQSLSSFPPVSPSRVPRLARAASTESPHDRRAESAPAAAASARRSPSICGRAC